MLTFIWFAHSLLAVKASFQRALSSDSIRLLSAYQGWGYLSNQMQLSSDRVSPSRDCVWMNTAKIHFVTGMKISIASTTGKDVVTVQLFSHIQLFATPWTAAHQAPLSITNSQSLLKHMSIESVMPSNHLILCHHLLLLPSIFPSIRVFSNESALRIRWPKYWSFNFSISPSINIQDWFPLWLTGLISLQSKGLSRVFSNTTVQKYQFFSAQPSLWSSSQHLYIITGKTIAFTNTDLC